MVVDCGSGGRGGRFLPAVLPQSHELLVELLEKAFEEVRVDVFPDLGEDEPVAQVAFAHDAMKDAVVDAAADFPPQFVFSQSGH